MSRTRRTFTDREDLDNIITIESKHEICTKMTRCMMIMYDDNVLERLQETTVGMWVLLNMKLK